MMYPFMTLNDETEIVHSDMNADGTVKVYIETPDAEDGFHNLTCYLPSYKITENHGYTDEEVEKFMEIIKSKREDLKMPQVFKVGAYWVYFWANEGEPIEPIHVHISEGSPKKNATKVWITAAGKCIVDNNLSNIPKTALRNIVRIIEARSDEVIEKWIDFFGDIRYYC